MQIPTNVRLDDPALDGVAPDARETWLLEALREQIAFMRSHVPYWSERLRDVDEGVISSLSDLRIVPILSKEEFRSLRPAALVPPEHLGDIALGRWTSGTSGRPTVNFWSRSDWAALVASTARMLAPHSPATKPIAFNGYSNGHLTGPLYSAALRSIGGVVYERSHHAEDVFSTPAQMELFHFDTLVLPDRMKQGKGVGLADLLTDRPHLLADHRVRWWIGSSGTFEPQTIEHARRQGVASVSNLCGASEFGLFGISCRADSRDFHVAQGHVLVEVVDDEGAPVRSGRSGRVVVTHLRGVDELGEACAHRGTQILRLAGGDGATWLTVPCGCGLTTPRLRDIQRLS